MIKKLLLTTLLTLISTNAMAEWTVIFKGIDSGYDIYTDFKSIRKIGNKVKLWTLNDFKEPVSLNGKQHLSFVKLEEYDCVNETTRLLSMSLYSGNMQKGRVIDSANYAVGESTHEPITPNSIGSDIWRIACSKK